MLRLKASFHQPIKVGLSSHHFQSYRVVFVLIQYSVTRRRAFAACLLFKIIFCFVSATSQRACPLNRATSLNEHVLTAGIRVISMLASPAASPSSHSFFAWLRHLRHLHCILACLASFIQRQYAAVLLSRRQSTWRSCFRSHQCRFSL